MVNGCATAACGIRCNDESCFALGCDTLETEQRFEKSRQNVDTTKIQNQEPDKSIIQSIIIREQLGYGNRQKHEYAQVIINEARVPDLGKTGN